MTAIGIIGTGAVGQAVTSTLVSARFGARLLVMSSTLTQSVACAADLQDMAIALGEETTIQAVDAVEDLHDCAAIVVCVRGDFTTGAGTDIRLGGLAVNSRIVRQIAQRLRGYRGAVLMVTNPVDVLARVCAAVSGTRVYGVGAGLDTARYRAALAIAYDVPASRVSGHVIGEHGDAAVCCPSTTTIDGEPIQADDPRTHAAIEVFRDRSTMIRHGVGRVRAGAAGAVLAALRVVTGETDGVAHLSTRCDREDVWLGQPITFTSGAATINLPTLSSAETMLLDHARNKLIAAYRSTIETPSPTPDAEEIAL